jgi:hypothetical protein
MKRNAKSNNLKLSLHREVIAVLSSLRFKEVVGGTTGAGECGPVKSKTCGTG